MDRSNFNFRGSTNDLEKRLEFKAKLANKIEPPQHKELLAAENTFNGVSPGGILVHPSLGEGILVEVDHGNNEVLIDFGAKGLIGLVLSQAKSFVHAPIKETTKGIAGKDDAFLGGDIQSRMLAPQDRDYREVDLSRITSPDFVVIEKKFIPVGSLVWHPDLGACRIASLNEATNSLSLDTPLNGRVDMVLSQVHAKLREIDSVADHVPVKPLVREPLGQRFPQYKSRGDVKVSLPEVFNNWQRNQQFMFLTRSQHLTTEQANDVFSVLEDKKPLFHTVTVSWQSVEETQTNIIPGREDLSVKPELVVAASILDQEAVWHPDLGECTISSVDKVNNQLILMTSIGQIPCVLDVTVPTLAPIALNSGIKRAPKALRTSRVLAAMEGPVKDRPKVSVSIPEAIVTWKAAEQFQFLTSSIHLTPEQANDIVASMQGTLRTSKHEYTIQWTDEIPEAEKRVEVEKQLSAKADLPKVEQELPAPPAPVDLGVQRVVEEVVEVKKTQILRKLEVNLPTDFNKWTASGQYVFLTRTKHLTSNEANDVLDVLHGKPINSKIQYEIVWSE